MANKPRMPECMIAQNPLMLEFCGAQYLCSLVTSLDDSRHSSVFQGTIMKPSTQLDMPDEIMVKFYKPPYEEIVQHAFALVSSFQHHKRVDYTWCQAFKRVNPLYPKEGETFCIARNRYAGSSIFALLRAARLENRQEPLAALLEVLYNIAHSVRLLHESVDGYPGIVHRDIKPSNIILADMETNRAILIDFDIACAIGEQSAFAANTAYHGTYVYLAPEFFFPEIAPQAPHPSCDVYSIGVLFYELIEGCWPFWVPPERLCDNSFWRDFYQSGSLRKPQKMVPELADIIMSMLDKDWTARPTAFEVEQALLSLKNTLSEEILNTLYSLQDSYAGPNPTPMQLA